MQAKIWLRVKSKSLFQIRWLNHISFHLNNSCDFNLFSDCNGLIVPQELPSVLSLVYSNIPPVKKGTDSRVGFGFRLGEHADFQVMFELGPQKFTKPIGMCNDIFSLQMGISIYINMRICVFILGKPSPYDNSDTSKRMVDQSDYSQTIKVRNSSQTIIPCRHILVFVMHNHVSFFVFPAADSKGWRQ